MNLKKYISVLVLIVAGSILSACGNSSVDDPEIVPACVLGSSNIGECEI